MYIYAVCEDITNELWARLYVSFVMTVLWYLISDFRGLNVCTSIQIVPWISLPVIKVSGVLLMGCTLHITT